MYLPIIGLEIHIELKTKSKMFCSCKNDPEERRPNYNICPICLGHPGTLPVINKEAVRKVIKTGLALNCQIPEYSKFDRKNYFYPDLPKGYQISQYDSPLCLGGYLEISSFEENLILKKSKIQNPKLKTIDKAQIPKFKKIRIRRIHLEEDTGKLLHFKDYSLVDFNRAGVPLMELVTEPDINSALEARKFAEELQLILRYLDVSDADMEKGQLRVEANISLSQISNLKTQKLGTKVEIKNLNSFRAVEKAIEYEIERQREILNSGNKVIQETRGWDETKEITVSQREKEEAQDYRYFPEPDLPPLNITHEIIEKIRAEIPELPWQKQARFEREYYLTPEEADFFTHQKELGEYFEKVLSELRNWIKEAEGKREVTEKEFQKLINFSKNYLKVDLTSLLGAEGLTIDDKRFSITPENFAEFIKLLYRGEISSKIAKILLAEMFKTGADPSHIIEEKGLAIIEDSLTLEKIIDKVIENNPKPIEDFKKGKEQALQFLIGQTMKETNGRGKPEKIKEILTRKLKGLK